MKKYKLIIFDVDGVLLNTSKGILASVDYTVKHFNLQPLPRKQVLNFIGPPIQDSFSKYYGIVNPQLQEIATVFRDRYKNKDLLKAKRYSGILDLFKTLKNKGYMLAIATYKRQDYAELIMQHFGFSKYANIIYGSDHENKLKKFDIIKKCIEDSGIKQLSEAVMIGDTENDAIGASKANIDFIGVSYGFGFKNDADVNKYNNVGTAGNAKEILKIIEGE